MEDVSFFDDDDDEDYEADGEESASTKLKNILHIRTSSSNQVDETAERKPMEWQKIRGLMRLRKSLSDVASDANETLKGVFRSKK